MIHGKYSYRVHDLILDFARAKLRAKGMLIDVRRLFLETLREHCVDGEWSKFQGNKEYFFGYLAFHLCSSEQYGQLLQLFFSFHWLEEKLRYTNLPSLLSDFRFLSRISHDIELLKSSLMLSADVIENHPHSIGLQLLGKKMIYLYDICLVLACLAKLFAFRKQSSA